MAKEKDSTSTTVPTKAAPTEFSVTLEEFLTELSRTKVETKAGFTRALTNAKMQSGRKSRQEWNRLLNLFNDCPARIKFADWAAKGGK